MSTLHSLQVMPMSMYVYKRAQFASHASMCRQFAGHTSLYEAQLVGCTSKQACIQSGLVRRSYQFMFTTRLGLHHTSVHVYNQFWFTGHICMCTIRLGLLVTPVCMCTTRIDLAQSVGICTAGLVCRLHQRPHSKDEPR